MCVGEDITLMLVLLQVTPEGYVLASELGQLLGENWGQSSRGIKWETIGRCHSRSGT